MRKPNVTFILLNNKVAATVDRVNAKDEIVSRWRYPVLSRVHLRMDEKTYVLSVHVNVFNKESVIRLFHKF